MTGLGGSGKTQLVLHYLQEHEDKYNAILWIDARNEETARSSFVRCCRALGSGGRRATDRGRLHDAEAVQSTLQWLRGRGPKQEWLVVLDNVDDLSWEMKSIVPQGQVGSVIVTSQDTQATRLLGGGSGVVRVDVMETEVAVSLLQATIAAETNDEEDQVERLSRELVKLLDNLPLGIELARARIAADMDDGLSILTALRQYVCDFRRHQEGLLRSNDYVNANQNSKTVWTAWETSLSALRKLTTDDFNPLSFLILLSQLDGSTVQNELFRLASLGWTRLSTSWTSTLLHGYRRC